MSVTGRAEGAASNIVRCGHLKKLKTSKKKFFVLRSETQEGTARLEYYDSEKNFNKGAQPKRSIGLRGCFNINKRLDTRQKHVIGLYTKDDCFCIVLENEEDCQSWLRDLLILQHGREDLEDGEVPKPNFEHVWQVSILTRGLGNRGMLGPYRLCLQTNGPLFLVKVTEKDPQIELTLDNVRSCGKLDDFFFLEVGRSSSLGGGELWMQTEDNYIAQNVHLTVLNAMSVKKKNKILQQQQELADMEPRSRNRSSSATESSKPSSMGRKLYAKHLFSQDVSQTTDSQVPSTSSSSQHPIVSGVASLYHHLIQRGTSKAAERRHSISAGGVSTSGVISHQRTQSLPLANPPAPISDHTSHPSRNKRSNQSSKCLSGGRERCDSMPSRARTSSEGTHLPQPWTRSHLLPHRPSSLYNHSPPTGSPVSPPSASDSAGSSYSLADEPDGCYGHSLTPDEAIAEEDCPDSPTVNYNYMPMNHHNHSSDDGYVDMSPKSRHHNNSPSASMSSVTSGTPSSDLRFAEYTLEPVKSYFAPTDEDEARPARAYSVGSRQDCYLNLNKNENLRVRALSVGSKTKKCPSRILPPHNHSAHAQHGHYKSTSAPILSNNSLSRTRNGSYNSIGPMDDLMEMDFSSSRSGSINSGYMDMKPKNLNSGYVEMTPGIPESAVNVNSPYVDMTAGTSPGARNGSNDYMDMGRSNNNRNNNNSYMDMSFNNKRVTNDVDANNYQVSPAKSLFLTNSTTVAQNQKTPEGYVEMSVGKGHKRVSSLDLAQSSTTNSEDYANMSIGGTRKRVNSKTKKDKTRSQPINIQNPQKGNKASSSSSSPLFTILGRKFSTGTPPTMNLPLADYSSLPRQQRSRKNSNRRDSKDSSSSSVTTPSSSSTIFPLSLNSPCSPVNNKPPETVIKVPQSVLNAVYKKSQKPDSNMAHSTSRRTDDYIQMDFDKTKDKSEDYMNFDPVLPTAPRTDVFGDYAIMRPLVTGLATVSMASDFRPICEEVSTSSETANSGAGSFLYYASLDLDDGSRSPRQGKEGEGQTGLTYAAINFNAKVKH